MEDRPVQEVHTPPEDNRDDTLALYRLPYLAGKGESSQQPTPVPVLVQPLSPHATRHQS